MKNESVRAKNYCFRIFKIRPRSEFELRQKLNQKKFTQDLIEATIEYFKQIGLLNDLEFARFWISSRIRRPLGARRLFYELKLRGISEEILKKASKEFKDFDQEAEIVKDLAISKFNRIKEKDKFKAKAKVYAFLMRRGFSAEAIGDALREL